MRYKNLVNLIKSGDVSVALENRLEQGRSREGERATGIGDIVNNGTHYTRNMETRIQGGLRCIDGTHKRLTLQKNQDVNLHREIWNTDDGREFLVLALNNIDENDGSKYPALQIIDITDGGFEEAFTTERGRTEAEEEEDEVADINMPHINDFDMIIERYIFESDGKTLEKIERKSTDYFRGAAILRDVNDVVDDTEVAHGDDQFIVKRIEVEDSVKSRVKDLDRVYVGSLHNRTNQHANDLHSHSDARRMIVSESYTLEEDRNDDFVYEYDDEDGNEQHKITRGSAGGSLKEVNVRLSSLNSKGEAVYAYLNIVGGSGSVNNTNWFTPKTRTDIKLENLGLLGSWDSGVNGTIKWGKVVGNKRIMIAYIIAQKDGSTLNKRDADIQAKTIADYVANAATLSVWDNMVLRQKTVVEIENIWDRVDTKIGGEFISPKNIEFEFVANTAHVYDRTGDNPPIKLKYNPSKNTFSAHTDRFLNLGYDAEGEARADELMDDLGYPVINEDDTQDEKDAKNKIRDLYKKQVKIDANKQFVSYMNPSLEATLSNTDIDEFDRLQLFPEAEGENINLSEAEAVPSGWYITPFSKYSGYPSLMFSYQNNLFMSGGTKPEDLFMSTAYDKDDFITRIKIHPFQEETATLPEYDEESNIFSNLGMIVPLDSGIIWVGKEARLLIYTAKNPISVELLDPTDIVAAQLRNYERFKIDRRVPPIVADNSTVVISNEGEIYRQEITNYESNNANISFNNLILDRLPPSKIIREEIGSGTISTTSFAAPSNFIRLVQSPSTLFDRNNRPVSIGYWLDRRDGTRRIIMPMQDGTASIMTLSNEHKIKAFNLWDWSDGTINRKIRQVASFGNKLYLGVENGEKWELHEYDESLSKIAEGDEENEQELYKEFAPFIPKTFATRTKHRSVYKICFYVEGAKIGDDIEIFIQNPNRRLPKRVVVKIRTKSGFVDGEFTGFIKKHLNLDLSSLNYRSGIGGFIFKTKGKMVISQVEFQTSEPS